MDDATRGLLARALAVLRDLEHIDDGPCPKCCRAYSHDHDCDLKRTIDELAAAIGEDT